MEFKKGKCQAEGASGYTDTQLQSHNAQGCSYVMYRGFEMRVG